MRPEHASTKNGRATVKSVGEHRIYMQCFNPIDYARMCMAGKRSHAKNAAEACISMQCFNLYIEFASMVGIGTDAKTVEAVGIFHL